MTQLQHVLCDLYMTWRSGTGFQSWPLSHASWKSVWQRHQRCRLTEQQPWVILALEPIHPWISSI